MQPIKFPEATNTLAKGQPQYRVLPVCVKLEYPDDPNSVKKFTCKYELSDLEVQQIIKTKAVFISQFGFGFQPIYPQVDSPFSVCPIQYKHRGNNIYDFWVFQNDKSWLEIKAVDISIAITLLMETTGLEADQLLFQEKPSLQVDDKGNLKMM